MLADLQRCFVGQKDMDSVYEPDQETAGKAVCTG